MRYFVHNLETDKLNIFTDGKADWQTIPEADRDRIKNSCLWSRSINGWVSRAKGGKVRFYALDALTRNGFEDRGTTGEKLSFTERIEAEQTKAETRADRMEALAEKAEEKSTALYNHAHKMAEAIPFGQPIIVGHYSEGRDRRFRERIHNTFGRAFEEGDKAKYYEGRAQAARQTADGSKYSDPRYLGNRIKEVTAVITQATDRLEGKYYHADSAGTHEVTDEYRQRLIAILDENHEALEFYQHCLDNCGKTVFNRASLKDKQVVKIRGGWYPILKLNPTTVAVPNMCYPRPEDQDRYALKYPYTHVEDSK